MVGDLHWRLKQGDWMISPCIMAGNMAKIREAFLQTADIFVFPTFYFNECFPLVIIEAMMNGLPVISTDEGGIRDEVKDGKMDLW